MAAIDPSAKSADTSATGKDSPARATLKMVYDPSGPESHDSDDSDDEDSYIKALQDGIESDGLSNEEEEDDDDISSDEEEEKAGPSDPSKSPRARKEAAAQSILDALAEQDSEDDSDDEMKIDSSPKINGIGSVRQNKGKGKAKAEDLEEEDDESIEDGVDGIEEMVLCTLDPAKVGPRYYKSTDGQRDSLQAT